MQFGNTFETQQHLMKAFCYFLICLFIASYDTAAQGISIDEWNNEAAANIRLLPKYGYARKTRAQKEADAEFITASMKTCSSRREASDKMIAVGFKYLYKDVKTAMYRFNQAYLLDSANSDIYWGFGGVYMVLGDLERARAQYQYGLKHAPGNAHLLTDYGTYFLLLHYAYAEIDKKRADLQLDSAITYLNKSFTQNAKDPNTCYKLSVVNLLRNDCKKAKHYHDLCLSLDAHTIDTGFTTQLRQKCK